MRRVPPRTRRSDGDVALAVALGQRVRSVRKAHGLTQEALAHAAGVTIPEIGAIERAEREPGLYMLGRLATGLGIPLAELFQGVG